MIIEYVKMNERAKTPTRGNPSDAGLDIYASLDGFITIEPGQNSMVPTGLKFGIPHGYMLQVCNRSSMGVRRSLVVGAHIIDSGYDGEVFIDLHNIGSQTQIIEDGNKVAQLILVPVVHFRPREISEDELYSNYPITISNRGIGSLGSTDHPLGNIAGF